MFGEGTHFIVPWFETPIIYDVRAKPRNIASLTGTKGGLALQVSRRNQKRATSREAMFSIGGSVAKNIHLSSLNSQSLPPCRTARFTNGQHNSKSAIKAKSRRAAKNLQNLGSRLWRTSSSLHRQWSAEVSCGSIQRQPAHYATWTCTVARYGSKWKQFRANRLIMMVETLGVTID